MRFNGVYTVQPTSFQVLLSDLDNESSRDASGTMYRDRIATKRKLTCEWNFLSTLEISQILGIISNVFFDVTYLDPWDGKEVTRTFYSGDRTVPAAATFDSETVWNLNCNFIEK